MWLPGLLTSSVEAAVFAQLSVDELELGRYGRRLSFACENGVEFEHIIRKAFR